MRFRLTLQGRVLMLIAGGMALILLLSAYLHQVITRSLIEDDRYNTAIGGTVAIAARIGALQLFTNPEALQRDIQLVANAPKDFEQVDVFQRAGEGLRLAASTAPGASRLPALNGQTADNELREMEHPLPEVVTMEGRRDDELGEIAQGFNVMMEELSAKDREREALLTRISRFNKELSEEVARATGEVRSAHDALLQSQQRLARSERLAAMGHVAASLAHGIWTPLKSLSGPLGLLAHAIP